MEAQALHNRARSQGQVLVWSIYERPPDFPQSYIARPHRTVYKPGALLVYLEADSVEALRAKLPAGLSCLNRSDSDEPQVLESWL